MVNQSLLKQFWPLFIYFSCLKFIFIEGCAIKSDNININYNQLTDIAELSWISETQDPTQTVLLDYILQMNYTYTRGGITLYHDEVVAFKLSSTTSGNMNHTVQLEPHSFTTNSGVSAEIVVSLQLLNCGSSMDGNGQVVTGHRNTGIQVRQVPEYACERDNVIIVCDLTVPNPITDAFTQDQLQLLVVGTPDIIINGSGIVDPNGNAGTVTLERLTPSIDTSSHVLNFKLNYSLNNYTGSDTGILLGCNLQYNDGNSDSAKRLQTGVNLQAFAFPDTPVSPIISISTLNPSTCVATVNINWPTPTQPNSHTLYHNQIEIAMLNAPLASYSHSNILLLNTEHKYSVAASNCKGTSPHSQSAVLPTIGSYEVTSVGVSVNYKQDRDVAVLSWTSNMQNEFRNVFIQYYLQVNHTYTRDGKVSSFSNTSNFHLLSNATSHSVYLPPHHFSANNSDTSIEMSVSLQPMQQCGQTFPHRIVLGSFTSEFAPGPPEPVGSNIALIASILGIICFGILFFSVLLIILVVWGMFTCYSMMRRRGSYSVNGQKIKGFGQNDLEKKIEQPQIAEDVYANPEHSGGNAELA